MREPATPEDEIARGGRLAGAAPSAEFEPELPAPREYRPRPSRRKGVLVAAGTAVVFASALGAFGLHQRRTAVEAAERGHTDLLQCLIGESADSPDEAVLFLRRHQVALMTRSEEARGGKGAAWPERCAEPALRVAKAAGPAGFAVVGNKGLGPDAAALAELLTDQGFSPKLWDALHSYLDSAKRERLRSRTSLVLPPPAHPRALTLDDLPPSAFVTRSAVPLRSLETSSFPSDQAFFFVDHREAKGPFVCFVRNTQLACEHVAPTLRKAKRLHVLGTADPGVAPLLIEEAGGVYRSDTGSRVEKLAATSAYRRRDQLVVLLGLQEGRVTYAIQRKDNGPTVALDLVEELTRLFDGELEQLEPARDLLLAHGQLFVRKRDQNGSNLFALAVTEDGRLGSPRDLGMPDVSGPLADALYGCSSKEGLVLRVHGAQADAVATLNGGRLSTWATTDARLQGADVAKSCEPGSYRTFTANAVQTCRGASCDTQRLRFEPKAELAARPGTRSLAPIAGDLLFVWAAAELGAVRTKRGSSTTIDESDDSVLFDDRIVDGKLSELPSVSELRVWGGESGALVLMQTAKGLASLSLQADGTVQPTPVEWDAGR
jgi:hypothetical protein